VYLAACLCSEQHVKKTLFLYLEHSDKGLREAVKGAAGFGLVGKVELSSKHLHPQQGENDNEKEKEQQQAGNGTDGVQERGHQITERCPISRKHSNSTISLLFSKLYSIG